MKQIVINSHKSDYMKIPLENEFNEFIYMKQIVIIGHKSDNTNYEKEETGINKNNLMTMVLRYFNDVTMQ